jgi:hypothetical protein
MMTTRRAENIPSLISYSKYLHPLKVFPTPDRPRSRIRYAVTSFLSFPEIVFLVIPLVLIITSFGKSLSILIP